MLRRVCDGRLSRPLPSVRPRRSPTRRTRSRRTGGSWRAATASPASSAFGISSTRCPPPSCSTTRGPARTTRTPIRHAATRPRRSFGSSSAAVTGSWFPQILDALKKLGSRDGSDLVSAITEKDPPGEGGGPRRRRAPRLGERADAEGGGQRPGADGERRGIRGAPARRDPEISRRDNGDARGGGGGSRSHRPEVRRDRRARPREGGEERQVAQGAQHVAHRARRDGTGGEGGDSRPQGGAQGPGRLDQHGGHATRSSGWSRTRGRRSRRSPTRPGRCRRGSSTTTSRS